MLNSYVPANEGLVLHASWLHNHAGIGSDLHPLVPDSHPLVREPHALVPGAYPLVREPSALVPGAHPLVPEPPWSSGPVPTGLPGDRRGAFRKKPSERRKTMQRWRYLCRAAILVLFGAALLTGIAAASVPRVILAESFTAD